MVMFSATVKKYVREKGPGIYRPTVIIHPAGRSPKQTPEEKQKNPFMRLKGPGTAWIRGRSSRKPVSEGGKITDKLVRMI